MLEIKNGGSGGFSSKIDTYLGLVASLRYRKGLSDEQKKQKKQKLAESKLSPQELVDSLNYICNQTENIQILSRNPGYQQGFTTYPKEKLKNTGIRALATLQDNLIFLGDKKVKECAPYKGIFKNIIDYLSYVQLTGTEQEYNQITAELKPIAIQLLWDTTELRMRHETEEERKENISVYVSKLGLKLHTFPDIPSVPIMASIYEYNEESRELEREKTIADLLKEVDNYIEKKERENKKSLQNENIGRGEGPKTLPLKEEKLRIARAMKKTLESDKLSRDKISAIEGTLKSQETKVLAEHTHDFKRETENFFARLAKLLDVLAQKLSSSTKIEPKNEECHSKSQYSTRFFPRPRGAQLLATLEDRINTFKGGLRR
ncbi:MAG: hypothetical protein K0R48_1296 [Gammaproteobacteria bacterium]|jgi:hypothetical protein|nr:hypothetical protein [Gammaproteobacteria bacterium]